MEPKEEVHSDDGSYELVNEDDYASESEYLKTTGGVSVTMDLSDDSSYELLGSELYDTVAMTDDSDNPSDEEMKSSSESAKGDMEFESETASDPTEGDTGIDSANDFDHTEGVMGFKRVNKGKKRDVMAMLCERSNHDLFDFPAQMKLKDDIKEVAKNHIIRYLPAKSLFKCRKVSKEWNKWISCPFFAHTQSQYFRKTSGFFQNLRPTDTRFISLENSAYGVPYPSLRFLPKSVSIKSSCNGLLLCQAFSNEDELYICNPANKEWISLRPSNSYHGVDPKFVLAFEPSPFNFEPCYQVICLFSVNYAEGSDTPHIVYFDIYDSKTTFWRESAMICPDFDASDIISDAIFVNGVAYWETKGGLLLAFDLENEIYSIQNLPFDEGGALTNIRGETCYVRAQYDHAMKSCMLDVYGGGLMSLKNIITVSVDDVEDGEFVDCKVLSNSCDDVVALVVRVSQEQQRLYVYHVKDEKVQGPMFFNHPGKLFPYVNSLVSIY